MNIDLLKSLSREYGIFFLKLTRNLIFKVELLRFEKLKLESIVWSTKHAFPNLVVSSKQEHAIDDTECAH